MGEPPPWYLWARAARYGSVPIYELYGHGVTWRNIYLAAEKAETQAENDIQRKHNRAQRRTRA